MTLRKSQNTCYIGPIIYPLLFCSVVGDPATSTSKRGSVRQEMSSGRQQTIHQPVPLQRSGMLPKFFNRNVKGDSSKFWAVKNMKQIGKTGDLFIPLSLSIQSIKKNKKITKQTWQPKKHKHLVLLPSNMLASCTLQLSEGEQSVSASCWPHLSLKEQAPFLLENWIEDSYCCSTTRTTFHEWSLVVIWPWIIHNWSIGPHICGNGIFGLRQL